MPQSVPERRSAHWSRTRTLTFVVLFLWFLFGVVAPWFARELDAVTFLGFPLGYYMVVQGSLIAFVVLIVVQNMIQDNIDDKYGAGDI